mmetsp:Transcript_55984/g.88710  ORF Transcript_55984/g.88710 Transcript_55984/m.88710 type:complete len:284 (-) Transcript_55984:1318-2169(-)
MGKRKIRKVAGAENQPKTRPLKKQMRKALLEKSLRRRLQQVARRRVKGRKERLLSVLVPRRTPKRIRPAKKAGRKQKRRPDGLSRRLCQRKVRRSKTKTPKARRKRLLHRARRHLGAAEREARKIPENRNTMARMQLRKLSTMEVMTRSKSAGQKRSNTSLARRNWIDCILLMTRALLLAVEWSVSAERNRKRQMMMKQQSLRPSKPRRSRRCNDRKNVERLRKKPVGKSAEKRDDRDNCGTSSRRKKKSPELILQAMVRRLRSNPRSRRKRGQNTPRLAYQL